MKTEREQWHEFFKYALIVIGLLQVIVVFCTFALGRDWTPKPPELNPGETVYHNSQN